MSDIAVISYLVAAASLLALIMWQVTRGGKFLETLPVAIAACFSLAWAVLVAVAVASETGRFLHVVPLEAARSGAWYAVLLLALRHQLTADGRRSLQFRLMLGTGVLLPLVLLISALPVLNPATDSLVTQRLLFYLLVFQSVLGLFLIEQLFRNTAKEQRWHIKYLCLGLLGLFGFDFILYSDALLFRQLDVGLWQSRGFFNAICTLLLIFYASQNRQWQNINLSRPLVFHTTTLVASGIYLLIIAGGGFYLLTFGGNWGEVARDLFIGIALLVWLVLVFSERVQSQVKIFLTKHFFNYKYDYREEWLNLMRRLMDAGELAPLEQRAISALAKIVDSRGGSLWLRNNNDRFVEQTLWGEGGHISMHLDEHSSLVRFLETWQWVVNLTEYQSQPELYKDLVLNEELRKSGAWLIIPLLLRADLYGFVLLDKSATGKELNWEDIDLLKTASRQVTIQLAQEKSAEELLKARQFEAFNRFSAYVVHDLKNIVSQLALVVKNAEKHRHNPAFMDDAINTVENSVQRMQRLLGQLRSNNPPRLNVEQVDVLGLLQRVVEEKSIATPVPQLQVSESDTMVRANPERLSAILGHLVQNAQDATDDSGWVRLELKGNGDNIQIVISDNGCGMDADFVRDSLFKPFTSTKGLTGMGIGAFEAKEFIENANGLLTVKSEPGEGTVFTVSLPRIARDSSAMTILSAGAGE